MHFWPTSAWALPDLALGELLLSDGVARAGELDRWSPPDGRSHFRPKAKSVIWIFLVGGMSHLESFDPKPALNEFAGQEIGNTPHKDVLEASFVNENLRVVVPDDANGHIRHKLFPLQVGFQKRGTSGLEISDWWPHLGECVDDLAVVRSMWTTDNNHGAQLQFHTGRHVLEGQFPTIGSWVHYGLGSLNDNLPRFVVMGTPIADCCGGIGAHGANYLGPEHSGVQLGVDPKEPAALRRARQRRLSRRATERVRAAGRFESAGGRRVSRRQRSACSHQVVRAGLPHADGRARTWSTARRKPKPRARCTAWAARRRTTFGRHCLVARRLVEQGVRFVQIFHGSNGGAGILGRARQSEEQSRGTCASRSISRSPPCSKT